jgi:hypothetical protein
MLAKKLLVAIVFLLGIFSGAISLFSKNLLLSISLSLTIYFSCYLAFRKFFDLEEFLKETAIGYFGLWFIAWIILFNIF